MEDGKSGLKELRNPWTDYHKIWHGWWCSVYHTTCQNLKTKFQNRFLRCSIHRTSIPGSYFPRGIKLQKRFPVPCFSPPKKKQNGREYVFSSITRMKLKFAYSKNLFLTFWPPRNMLLARLYLLSDWRLKNEKLLIWHRPRPIKTVDSTTFWT